MESSRTWICCRGPVARSVHAAPVCCCFRGPFPANRLKLCSFPTWPHGDVDSPLSPTGLDEPGQGPHRSNVDWTNNGGALNFGLWSWQLQFDMFFFLQHFSILHPISPRQFHHLQLCNGIRRRHPPTALPHSMARLATAPSGPRCQAETGGRRSSRGPRGRAGGHCPLSAPVHSAPQLEAGTPSAHTTRRMQLARQLEHTAATTRQTEVDGPSTRQPRRMDVESIDLSLFFPLPPVDLSLLCPAGAPEPAWNGPLRLRESIVDPTWAALPGPDGNRGGASIKTQLDSMPSALNRE